VSRPLWIDCANATDVPEASALGLAASSGQHVVLRIRAVSPDEARELVARLSRLLPDHSMFVSGGDQHNAQVTLMPVVSRERIRSAIRDVLAAIAAYQSACRHLTGLRHAGLLGDEWSPDEHGGHCRFSNKRTGQVVEAPLDATNVVDPYFFAEFVQSTRGHEVVAALLTEPYHDAARILDVASGRV
jgi:hypothetical protein